MKMAIVDDDIKMKDVLLNTIHQWRINASFDYFSDPEEFLQRACSYDGVILDIKMEPSGFEIARQLKTSAPQILIIFLTAYTDLVYEAFGRNVVGFIDKNQLNTTLLQAWNKFLIEYAGRKTIILEEYDSTGKIAVTVSSIICCTSSGRKITVTCTGGREYRIRKQTIRTMLSLLDSDLFVMVSRSVIVNVQYICRLDRETVGMKQINRSFDISRKRYSEIEDAFMQYYSI